MPASVAPVELQAASRRSAIGRPITVPRTRGGARPSRHADHGVDVVPPLSYGPPWAHYLGGYQDRLLGGPQGLPDLRCTVPDGVKHKDYGGEVLG
jgi:hypothetical protein